MPGRVSIGMLALVLLLVLGLNSLTAQPSGLPAGQAAEKPADHPAPQPSDQPAAPAFPGGIGDTGSVPGTRPASESIPSTTMPGRIASPTTGALQDQFRSWLASSSEGRWYTSVSPRIVELAGELDRAGVPLDVLKIRMREAQAKKVGAEIFANALEADTSYWIRVAALLGDKRWPPTAKASDFYIAAGNALRNGVNEEAISTLISWALVSRGTPERASAVLISVSSLTGLMDKVELSRTAGVLAASRLRVGEFDGLVTLLHRAAAGKSSAELLAAMEEVLGNRGTLRTLESRLFP